MVADSNLEYVGVSDVTVDKFPRRFLDFIMQALDSRLLGSPLESQLYSCTPFLRGEGQAVHYFVKPLALRQSLIPVFASDNYLREALIRTLSEEDVEFDFMVQLQKRPLSPAD
jgi:hypothetical protein